MKTVAELASEIGVSKTAIRKKISELGLQSSLKYEKNRVVITTSQERKIKASFKNFNPETGTVSHPVDEPTEKNTETKQKQVDEPEANSSQTEYKIYDSSDMVPGLVNVLQQQLSEKDRQIEDLHQQLHDLNDRLKEAISLTDQQQRLQIHQAQLLTSGQTPSETVDAEAEPEEDQPDLESDQSQKEEVPSEPEPKEELVSDENPKEEAAASTVPEPSVPEEPKPKKGFWSRIFGS